MPETTNKLNKVAMSPYRDAISRHLRAHLLLKKKRYSDIIEGLAERGIELTETNLKGKISKGEMSADLFVLIMEIVGVEENTVIQIIRSAHEDTETRK